MESSFATAATISETTTDETTVNEATTDTATLNETSVAAAAVGDEATINKTTTTTTVRFSEKEPEIFRIGQQMMPPSTATKVMGKRQVRSKRKAKEEAQTAKKISDMMEQFTESLTLEKLEKTQTHFSVIDEPISGVPNNGEVPFAPNSFCRDCVSQVASYFEDEDVSRRVIPESVDEKVENVKIQDIQKLARVLLDSYKFRFYDHVTVEAFTHLAMEKGGPLYGVSLNLACIMDAIQGRDFLYRKLAGDENMCAAFSTGVAIRCESSGKSSYSENTFKTHGQCVLENVDLDSTMTNCFCFKTLKWCNEMTENEIKVKTMLKKENENIDHETPPPTVNEEDLENNNNDEDDDEDDEVVSFVTAEESIEDIITSNIFRDDTDFRPYKQIPVVLQENEFDNDEWSDLRTTSSCLSLCRHVRGCVVDVKNKAKVIDSITLFRIPPTENWRENAIASTTPGEYFAVVPDPHSYLAFSLGATTYEAMATVQGDGLWSYNLDPSPSSSSSSSSASALCSVSSLDSATDDKWVFSYSNQKKTAKVFTTVHTMAAPFLRSPPISDIDHQTKYGSIKTYRIPLPGNFSGRGNDKTLGWRSQLYSNITMDTVTAEGQNNRKVHDPFISNWNYGNDTFHAYPRQGAVLAEGGVIFDYSGDLSGNYLKFSNHYGQKTTGSSAYANAMNINRDLGVMRKTVNAICTGPFKQSLVEYRKFDLERTEYENAAGEEGLPTHAAQKYMDEEKRLSENCAINAQTIHKYRLASKELERDLGTMYKVCYNNLEGFSNCLKNKPLADESFYIF